MDITKIAVLGLVGAIFAVLLKESQPVFALMVSVITTVVIFIFIIPKIVEITGFLTTVKNYITIKTEYITVLIKAVIISYIAMFSSQLCRDFGQSAIGDKVEFGAKVSIMILAVPLITELIQTVLQIF